MKKNRAIKVLIIILVIFAAIAGGAYYAFRHYYSKSNFVQDRDIEINYEYLNQTSAGDAEEEIVLDEAALQEGYVGELESEIDLSQVQQASEEMTSGTYNILLIGVDRRTDDWYGNSDAMILLTVNHNVKKIFMTSFMRDLYADIPGYGVMKLNAAHAIGGGPLLVETLESNYGVVIDHYARVDFGSMIDIIDLVGGVDIDVSEAEAKVANNYISSMCKMQDKDADNYLITTSGRMHLDGMQAVAYSRIRYVGNSDYERTSRQREVLTEMIDNMKELSIGELSNLINELLPLVTHNVDEFTMLEMIARIPDLMNYELIQERVPYDGLFTTRNELLIPDFAATMERLHETIYAE